MSSENLGVRSSRLTRNGSFSFVVYRPTSKKILCDLPSPSRPLVRIQEAASGSIPVAPFCGQ